MYARNVEVKSKTQSLPHEVYNPHTAEADFAIINIIILLV